MNLKQYKNNIANFYPLKLESEMQTEKWIKSKYTNNETREILKDINNSLSREFVINYFNENQNNLKKGFILSIFWGYGKDNYGPYRLSKILENNKNIDHLLQNVLMNLINNNIYEAHKTLTNLKNIRVNFFSKYLYFLGRSIKMNKYPLIFDARVANGILKSANFDTILCSTITAQPSQQSNEYVNYVTEIHRLAKKINVEADQIELFLFNLGKENPAPNRVDGSAPK